MITYQNVQSIFYIPVIKFIDFLHCIFSGLLGSAFENRQMDTVSGC